MKMNVKNKAQFVFLIAGLLLIALLLTSTPSFFNHKNINKVEAAGDAVYTFVGGASPHYAVSGYTGTPTEITIPEEYDDATNGLYPVKVINDEAFKGCASLTSIVFPNNLVGIGASSFENCTSLASIIIPVNVTSCGSKAFAGCDALGSVTYAVNINLSSTGEYAFQDCTSLVSIEIPDSMTEIDRYTFSGCSKLETVTFGASSQLTKLGGWAFFGCSSLTSCVLPSGVTSIFRSCFANCSSLTNMTIPDGVETINASIFHTCTALNSVTLSPNTKTIATYVFFKCTSLTSIEIPSGVESIDNRAFSGCTALKSIKFAEGSKLKSIANTSLAACNALVSITLPDQVTNLNDCFDSCANLKEIILKGSIPPSIGSDIFNSGMSSEDAKIYVPHASVSTYKEATEWSNHANKIYPYPLEFVTINLDGGEFSSEKTFNHNVENNTITLINPVKAASTFNGWREVGKPGVVVELTLPADNTELKTYTAYWGPVYNVSYELNGGTNHVNNPANYVAEDLALMLLEPTRAGYTFDGWYDNLSFGGSVITEIPLGSTSDKTYYAKWTAKTDTPYTIKYYQQNIENDEYTVVETDSTKFGTTDTTASIIDYENKYQGFTFTETKSLTSGTIAGDGSLVLTAYYNRNKYKVNFVDFDNSPIIPEQEVKHGGNAIAPANNPTRTGYEFANWDTIFTNVTKALTVKATYTANQYTITFNTNCDAVVNSITQGYETAIEKPENPKRTGYTFVDWYIDNGEFQNLFVFDTMPLDGAILYAKWNPNTDTKYTIEYYKQNINNDGYTLAETDNTKFGTTDTTASIIGYVDKYAGFTYTEINSIISGIIAADGSLVLKAHYNRNNYIITFNSNGGSDVSQINKRYEAMVEAPAVPTKLGCTFDAWYTDNGEFQNPFEFNTMPLNGAKLYAKWNLIPYSIDYNLDGGNGDEAATNPTTYNVESENITLKNPKKAGYIFLGWTGTGLEECTIGVVISKGNTGHRVYTAHWTPSTNTAYKIRYYQEKIVGGYAFYEEETQYGTTDTNTTLTGYENKYPGFQYTATGSVLSGKIAGDGTLTLKVYYDRKIYRATFINENEQYDMQEIKYGGNIIKPASTPTKASDAKYTYTFKSWSPNVPETISADIGFVATYIETINKYKVTFVDFDDSVLKTQDVEYESTNVTAPINPTRVGYTFKGWDTSFKTIVGAITVRATYTINKYTITFKKNGEETQVVVNYGDKITKPADPQKTNCVFDGWYADVALTEKFDFNKVYNANKTIYSKWTCNVDIKLVIDDNPSEIKENIVVSKEGETWASLMEQYKDAKTGYTLTSLSYKNLDNAEINEITETTVLDYDSRFEVIANYEANQYEVFLYLDSDGKEALESRTVLYDEKIDFLEIPTREGYRFVGWYSNENDMFVQNGDIFAIPNDLALTARWEEESSNAQLMYIGIGIGVGLALIAGAIFIAAFVLKKKKVATQTNTSNDFIEDLPEKDDKE